MARNTLFNVILTYRRSFHPGLLLHQKRNQPVMKTIFDHTSRAELIGRIGTLTASSAAQWGKMNVYQMTRHCIIWNDWVQGKNTSVYKQGWLGKIFGKMALKGIVRDNSPMKRNMPAGSEFLTKEKAGNIEPLKKTWAEQIAAYGHFSNPTFIHDFFGKMTKEEIGILAYKHMDHHLRQFNV